MSDLMKKFTPPESNELSFVTEQEPWAIYRLEDGSRVKVRLNLVRVVNTGGFLDNGLPELKFQWAQVMDWEPTDAQKREAAERSGDRK